MAIDKLPAGIGNNAPLANKYKQSVTNDIAAGTKPSATSANQDSVTLTPQAQRLGQVQQTLVNTPAPDNSARLEALKKAINEGSYQVDSDKLAANISRFEQDLEGL
ncbi:hypothetical protein GCM10011502_17790 [Oceanisphaera marina]|uniref:Negative regulator of flagellin synthesis n=1 Tax=Oceanisphaera marina TaxID=2017550 RepID=A0ABQ1INW4_9GAMM|nr:flagellar biosynthesis anti-sigma factor FlgM [Oceanisphaera marina]GGB44938.1 hypothetical protein GCM10011502_17790 [Oceanisphaera marina]